MSAALGPSANDGRGGGGVAKRCAKRRRAARGRTDQPPPNTEAGWRATSRRPDQKVFRLMYEGAELTSPRQRSSVSALDWVALVYVGGSL